MWSLVLGLWSVPLCSCVGKGQRFDGLGECLIDASAGVNAAKLQLSSFPLGVNHGMSSLIREMKA